jgi:hypothetical protein
MIGGLGFSVAKSKPRAIDSIYLGLQGWLIPLMTFLLISITNLVYKELFRPSSNLFTILPILINIFLFISFLKKKTYYPWCQITVNSLTIVDEIIIMVMLYYHQLSNTTEPIKANIIIAVIIAKSLPSALIIAYLLKSKRVKNTFVY